MLLMPFKYFLLLTNLKFLNTLITIRPIPQLYVGDNVSIHCDLIEQDSIIIWERYPYNDPMNRTRLLGPNVPSRYRINNDIINDTYTVSILTISAIVSLDFSTFQCNSIDSATIDLIEAPPTTTTSTTTTSTTTPPTTTTPDPSTLCFNGNFNQVLFALLLISKFMLAIVLIGFTRLLKPNSTNDILVTFGCIVGSIGFLIIKVMFWISPDYVAKHPTNEYWSPIVIVPSSILAFCILWGGLFYYIIKTYLKKDKYIKIAEIVISSIIAFCHLFLLLVILCSVIYCTGKSVFSQLTTNYSVVSNICAGLIVASCFIFIIYFFWVFRDQLTTMEITPEEIKKKALINSLELSDAKNEKENIVTVSKITERRSSLTTREQMNNVNNPRKNSDIKDLNSTIRGSNAAIRSFVSEPRQNDLLLTTPNVETGLFINQKPKENVIDNLAPIMGQVSSQVGHTNVEEARSSFVNLIRRNSVVDVMKHSPQKEFEESTIEELNNETESIEEMMEYQYNDQVDIMNQTHIQAVSHKKKKKKIKTLKSEMACGIDGENVQNSPKKKKKVIKNKNIDESLSKEENEQQSDSKVKKTKKLKKFENLETV